MEEWWFCVEMKLKLSSYKFLRVVFNTLFGLSVSYWMAIATRFLLGALNGLLGPIKVWWICKPFLCYNVMQSIASCLNFTGLCHWSLPTRTWSPSIITCKIQISCWCITNISYSNDFDTGTHLHIILGQHSMGNRSHHWSRSRRLPCTGTASEAI